LSRGDAEDALPAADEVDDLVVRGAQIDGGSIAHQSGAGEVTDAGDTQLLDGGADLLQRDAGVQQPLDQLEDEDVTEAVEPLRPGAGGAADRGDHELGARPVVQLAVRDARRTRGHRAAVADLVVHRGQPVGEEEFSDEPRVACQLVRIHTWSSPSTITSTLEQRPRPGNDIRTTGKVCRNPFVTKGLDPAPGAP